MIDDLRPSLPTTPRQDWIGRLLRGIAIRIGSLAWLPRLLPQITAIDKFIQRRTSGRWSILRVACLPGVLLTVPGRKSGVPRTTPLLCVPHGDSVFVAGSNFGGPTLPVWVNNLRAAADPTMLLGGRPTAITAKELAGAERDEAWTVMVALWPNYAKYAARTDRTIPVFRLQPVE
ncbi:deazaflavin-dependent nitroreductase [Nocardioides baekrokdamisoli]|uniref:Deazaflavin-dependent nitroreductase n=1 Tax=Nocardioides baekrokdamisoli TaxID=1804624 RepID=A0A3G9IAQ1_9ACTN|nr:nitroreductase family deazaflavin-dependent oxidoreductase [Nocardioides baekrokdamisoli]BBH15837.1 deazaflavin-dependent nitroreductase [Nocardioides baekrokdamisoli]